MKNILFVADPLHTFKIYKDSTYVMMKELSARGVNVWACEPQDIFSPASSDVSASMQSVQLLQVAHSSKAGELSEWYKTEPAQVRALKEMDAIVLRQDPPFNSEYFYLTHLLQVAQRQGAKVFNDPQAVRDHPEKLSILEFPELTPPTLVSREPLRLREFHAHHKDIILKPLDGMGGMGIFRIKEDGLNLGSVIESLTANGAQTIMAQKFLPEIADGDKRVLLIDGAPVPYSLARIPQGGEVRGNLAAGGLGVARELTKAETEIANYLGPILSQRGLFLVGLDVIGDYLTEINVTSPTCFQEITQQKGYDVAKAFVDALFKRL
jgi:glutathione synthase